MRRTLERWNTNELTQKEKGILLEGLIVGLCHGWNARDYDSSMALGTIWNNTRPVTRNQIQETLEDQGHLKGWLDIWGEFREAAR